MSMLILENSMQILNEVARAIWPFDQHFCQPSLFCQRLQMKRIKNRLIGVQCSIHRLRDRLVRIERQVADSRDPFLNDLRFTRNRIGKGLRRMENRYEALL